MFCLICIHHWQYNIIKWKSKSDTWQVIVLTLKSPTKRTTPRLENSMILGYKAVNGLSMVASHVCKPSKATNVGVARPRSVRYLCVCALSMCAEAIVYQQMATYVRHMNNPL